MLVTPVGLEPVHVAPPHLGEDGDEFFELIKTYLTPHDCTRVREAFELARREHGDQRRRSGELFFTHPLTVAFNLAEYRLDAAALMAALLHDVAEDTLVSVAQIDALFGSEVSHLVDGVTKLKEVTAGVARGDQLTPQEIQDASLLKMFGFMTDDVRVVLIKLFDRLHNMHTIRALPPEKQRKKAQETLYVYAPLANRLGIWRIKTELEALSLRVLDNDAFRTIKRGLDNQFHKRQAIYARVSEQTIKYLQENLVNVVNVLPSPESIYTAYKILNASSAPYDTVQSPLRVVVLVEDVPSCYLALGFIHQYWRPVPGKFDDYIALSRENLYRALHTTVIYSDGQPLKVRFRSVAMNEVSEIGVLARWVYAGTPMWTRGIAERVDALFANISENINLEPQNYSTGVKSVVEDVFHPQVMVYTPRGDIIELPLGSTPVDFAYAIHTEVGNQCQVAYVNERPYPLNKPLHDGDQVRIVKSGWARPQRTWLDEDLGFLATGRARTRVRRWFRSLSEEVAIEQGRKLLQDELDMLGVSEKSHRRVAEQFNFEDKNDLYHAFGRAELLPTTVATRVLTQEWHQEPSRNIGRVVQTEGGKQYVITNAGARDLRLCRACNAHPGDNIVGFIRADGGVTVHAEGCYTLRPDPMADRTIKLAWGREGAQEVRSVTVQIDVYDRAGLLFEISDLLQDEAVNISAINTPKSEDDGTMRLVLELEVASPRQLVRILHRAHALVNVYGVRCLPVNGQPSFTPSQHYLPE
jgi:GTP pyrophosphokinase